MLIGEKTGENLTTGNNNLFVGGGESLIYKKLAGTSSDKNFDISNTYYNASATQVWSLENDTVSNPVVVSGNTHGAIEFCMSGATYNSKAIGIKSDTTYKNHRFSSVKVNNVGHLIKLDGTSGISQLKNKKFIRNFGGNNWGEYISDNNVPLVPDKSISHLGETCTSQQIYRDKSSNPTTSYKNNNCPIIYSPDDILKINFTYEGTDKEIIVKIYSIIQVIKKVDNGDIIFTDSGAISFSDLIASTNDYEIMDERIYFDILKDDSIASSNFMVDFGSDFTITHVQSSGQYNSIGSENLYLGISSGNSNKGENNINIGAKSGKNSSIGNNNTILGNNAGEFMGEGENNTIVGDKSGRYLDSTGNTIVGRKCGENSLNLSNNVIMGSETGTQLSGNNNILIGNKVNEENSTDKNSIVIGNNSKYSSSSSDNNITIGHGLDNTIENGLVIGNRVFTKVRDLDYAIDNTHVYIPVEDAQLFGYNELLRVDDGTNTNFLFTQSLSDGYLPSNHKSIIHAFPKGKCEIVENGDYIELRDYSLQLSLIDILPIGTALTDENLKRPIISLKLHGKTITNSSGIFEIYSLPAKSDDGSYDFITMKRLKSDAQEFVKDEIPSNLTLTDMEYTSVELDNNILILSQSSGTTFYGRKGGGTTNIFNGGTLRGITDGSLIYRINYGKITAIDGSDPSTLTIEGDINNFSVGDSIKIAVDSNTGSGSFEDNSYTILKMDNENKTIKISSQVNLSSVPSASITIVYRALHDNKIICGNTSSNKIMINGKEGDLADETAKVTVNGSLGLSDFLLLKVSDQSNLELQNEEAIIWLEESGGNPVLKIKYKNGSGVYKNGTISLSIS